MKNRRNTEAADEILTPDEIEEEFKIAKSTQAAMRSRRQIPFLMVGPRMPRYRRSEVMAWLAERAVPAEESRRSTRRS